MTSLNKRINRLLIPVRVFFLSTAFVVVDLFVNFIPSLALVRVKIRIGSLILLLAGTVSCGHHQRSSYKPAIPESTHEKTKSRTAIGKKDSIIDTPRITKEIPDTTYNNQPVDCYMQLRNDDDLY